MRIVEGSGCVTVIADNGRELFGREDFHGAGSLAAEIAAVIAEAKAEEREACAMLADGKASIARRTHAIHSMRPHVERAMLQAETCEEFAVAIRARSKQ